MFLKNKNSRGLRCRWQMFFLESQSFAFLLAIRVIRLTLSRDYSHNSINTLPEKLCASLGRDSSSPPSSSFFVPFSSLLWTVLCLCWGFLEHLHLSFSLLPLNSVFLAFCKNLFLYVKCAITIYDWCQDLNEEHNLLYSRVKGDKEPKLDLSARLHLTK